MAGGIITTEELLGGSKKILTSEELFGGEGKTVTTEELFGNENLTGDILIDRQKLPPKKVIPEIRAPQPGETFKTIPPKTKPIGYTITGEKEGIDPFTQLGAFIEHHPLVLPVGIVAPVFTAASLLLQKLPRASQVFKSQLEKLPEEEMVRIPDELIIPYDTKGGFKEVKEEDKYYKHNPRQEATILLDSAQTVAEYLIAGKVEDVASTKLLENAVNNLGGKLTAAGYGKEGELMVNIPPENIAKVGRYTPSGEALLFNLKSRTIKIPPRPPTVTTKTAEELSKAIVPFTTEIPIEQPPTEIIKPPIQEISKPTELFTSREEGLKYIRGLYINMNRALDKEEGQKAVELRSEIKSAQELLKTKYPAITQPKTLIGYISANGGLDPEALSKDYNLSEWKQVGLVSTLKTGGRTLDDFYDELVEQNLIPPVPENYTPSDWVKMQLEASKGKLLEGAKGFEKAITEEMIAGEERFLGEMPQRIAQAKTIDELKSINGELLSSLSETNQGQIVNLLQEIDKKQIELQPTEQPRQAIIPGTEAKMPGTGLQAPDLLQKKGAELGELFKPAEEKGLIKLGDFSITQEDLIGAVDQFASKAVGFQQKAGKTLGFDKLLRTQQEKKLWEEMTPDERKAEFKQRVIDDFREATKEIGDKPVDYVLNRALDPLDPMAGVYKILLKKVGAIISGDKIKLPDKIEKQLEAEIGKQRYGITEKGKKTLVEAQKQPVLPLEEKQGKAITPKAEQGLTLAIKLKNGTIISDKTAELHSDIITNKGINPDEVKDVGILDKEGNYQATKLPDEKGGMPLETLPEVPKEAIEKAKGLVKPEITAPKRIEPQTAFQERDFKSINDFKNRGEFLEYIEPQLKEVKHPYVSGSKTVRPYVVGYGCDGSTDANIHYVAQKMSKDLGWDYAEIYNKAYPDERGRKWIKKDLSLLKDEAIKTKAVKDTTIIPKNTTIQNVLDDLYDINNRSLVEELENRFEKAEISLDTKLTQLKEIKPIVKAISPELQPLAQEARKYKSTEEFVSDYQATINFYEGMKKLKPEETIGMTSANLAKSFKGDIAPYDFKRLQELGIDPIDFYNQAVGEAKEDIGLLNISEKGEVNIAMVTEPFKAIVKELDAVQYKVKNSIARGIINDIQYINLRAHREAAEWLSRVDYFKGVTKEMDTLLTDLVEGKHIERLPKEEFNKLYILSVKLKKSLREAFALAQTKGVRVKITDEQGTHWRPIQEVQNYIPREINKDIREQLNGGLKQLYDKMVELRNRGIRNNVKQAILEGKKSDNTYIVRLLQWLEEKQMKMAPSTLVRLIDKLINRDYIASYGHLERPRLLENALPPEFYERRASVLFARYFASAARRIAEIEKFGQTNERLLRRLRLLERTNPEEGKVIRDLLKQYQDKSKHEISSTIATVISIMKIGLGTSTIPNITQLLISTIPKQGVFNFLRGAYDLVVNPQTKEYIRKTGLPYADVVHGILGLPRGGVLDKINDILVTLNWFKGINRLNALLTASSTERWVKGNLLPRTKSGNKAIKTWAFDNLAKLKILPTDIKEGKVSEEKLIDAMLLAAQHYQLFSDVTNEPLWLSNPQWRWMTVLKRFGYKQPLFAMHEIIYDELKHKNPLPLLRLIAGGILGGAFVVWANRMIWNTVAKVKEIVTGEPVEPPNWYSKWDDEDRTTYEKALDLFSQAGTVGMLSDITRVDSQNKWSISRQVEFQLKPVVASEIEEFFTIIDILKKVEKKTGRRIVEISLPERVEKAGKVISRQFPITKFFMEKED